MIEKTKQFIQIHRLINNETKHIFVAVSGGIDSCVLLNILHTLKNDLGYNLSVIHFNHHTRGKESDQDQVFVEQLAAKYNLDIRIGSYTSSSRKISETALREARYKFFNRVLSRRKNAVVATGHNRDDSIETFLMRLAKGSGLRGLLSIRPQRKGFIRPLLSCSREEIAAYAVKNNLAFRSDRSNQDQSIQRNYIRHTVLPFLRKHLDTNLDDNLEKTINDLNFYHALYEEKLKEAIISSTKKTRAGMSLNRNRYQYFNPAVRRGLIEYCISSIYPLNYKVSDRNFRIWEQFIITAQAGKKHAFLDIGTAVAERHQIIFGDLPRNREDEYLLSLGKSVTLDQGYTLSLNKIKAEEVTFSRNHLVEFIDGEKSGKQLMVRFWKKGDRFKPLGMKNRRKLSDFFIDIKLSTRLKKEVPIVCKLDKIVWIAGYRLDENFKVTEKTNLFYKLEMKRDV
jgi:tRNA(Ile)-lysidine synthase